MLHKINTAIYRIVKNYSTKVNSAVRCTSNPAYLTNNLYARCPKATILIIKFSVFNLHLYK